MSLTLLYQTHSPFARKALVFAHEAGLAVRWETVRRPKPLRYPPLADEELAALIKVLR